MFPKFIYCVRFSEYLLLLSVCGKIFNMTEFDSGMKPKPQNEEDCLDGVTFTEDDYSHFIPDYRALELLRGVLVDVSEMAREAGFTFPVAVTRALWKDINAIPDAYDYEDVKGRLWDVLHLAIIAIKQHTNDSLELRYNLVLHVGDTSIYPVKLICGPGADFEPVITLSNPDKDIELALGEVVVTEGAMEALLLAQVFPTLYLMRHRRGDWGELDEEDIKANIQAAVDGERILSAYTLSPTQQKIWIITERDRSVTTILLPSEY